MTNLLQDIYTEIYGPIEQTGRLRNLAEMAETLSALSFSYTQELE